MRFRVVDVTRVLFVPPCVLVTESLSGSLRLLQRIYAGSGRASRAVASPVQAGHSVALSAPAVWRAGLPASAVGGAGVSSLAAATAAMGAVRHPLSPEGPELVAPCFPLT